jgi:hypothetical protein
MSYLSGHAGKPQCYFILGSTSYPKALVNCTKNQRVKVTPSVVTYSNIDQPYKGGLGKQIRPT